MTGQLPRGQNDDNAGVRTLRAELDNGVRSLDAGKGQELDAEQFLAEARA